MWLLYGIACIPIVVWFIVWIFWNKVNWIEMVAGSVISLMVAGIFHGVTYDMMTADTEVLSGQITRATFHPEWVEEYQEMHTSTSTDADGNTTTSVYYTTEHRTHRKYWDCDTDLGQSHNITIEFFNQIKQNFNNLTTEKPYKSGFDGGDRNIYVSYNKTGYIYPVTMKRAFKNLLQCSDTVYSMPKVPKGVSVFEYPYPSEWNKSNRLINENRISVYDFDCLNTKLGFFKHINIIMINFGKNKDSGIAEYQRSKFLGGKKNDLVICYSKEGVDEWAKVFSWSESELCKRNLETIILRNPINKNILNQINNEIIMNYTAKDWSKFDYISIEPSGNAIIVYFIIVLVVQGGCFAFAFFNEIDKQRGYKCTYGFGSHFDPFYRRFVPLDPQTWKEWYRKER
jgi:hypothetical protein